jgi:cell division septum initiation protein DivIVA
MASDGADHEMDYLRAECDRLRKDRDIARKERQDADNLRESESTIRLKLLAESLSQEVKDRFLNSLKNALWLATLFLGIATAGGLWKLSDIVSARIDDKVKEKEKDVDQLRQQIIKSVFDFQWQAAKSLEEIQRLKEQVANESARATGEIRQAQDRAKSIGNSLTGDSATISASNAERAGITAWFGQPGDKVAVIAGSQAGQLAYEDGKAGTGAFSIRFQSALQNPFADINQDGRISLAEAAAFTRTALRRDGFDQVPTVAGPAMDTVALFASGKRPEATRYRKLIAVVVGINKYQQPNSELRGAVNDAMGFANMIEHGPNALFAESKISLLSDGRATYAAVSNALTAIAAQATKEDLVVFYFSGHVGTVGPGSEARKVIYPTDGELGKSGYLRIDDVVKRVGAMGARHAMVIVDG